MTCKFKFHANLAVIEQTTSVQPANFIVYIRLDLFTPYNPLQLHVGVSKER